MIKDERYFVTAYRQKNSANGVAGLDSSGLLSPSVLPNATTGIKGAVLANSTLAFYSSQTLNTGQLPLQAIVTINNTSAGNIDITLPGSYTYSSTAYGNTSTVFTMPANSSLSLKYADSNSVDVIGFNVASSGGGGGSGSYAMINNIPTSSITNGILPLSGATITGHGITLSTNDIVLEKNKNYSLQGTFLVSTAGVPITTPLTFNVTGATTSAPLYAFNSTNVPTITNGTIVGNTFVANANSASAQTISYQASSNIGSYVSSMTFNPIKFMLLYGATTTSVRLNGATNSLLSSGQKVILNIGGTWGEYTAATVSTSGSTPASSWNNVTMPSTSNWYSAVWAPLGSTGTWVVTSATTAGAISTNNGTSFSAMTLPSNGIWSGLAYGNGIFVAIRQFSAATSSNGSTWTAQTFTHANSVPRLAFGNGIFMTVQTGTANATTTTDGVTWTNNATLPSSNTWQDATFNGVDKWVAISQGTAAAYSIDNGLTWTASTLPTLSTGQYFRIVYGNGLYLALANSGNQYATSPDGITWTQRTLPASQNWRDVTCGRVFVVCYNSSVMYSSADGITWTTQSNAANVSYNGLAYGNGNYFLCRASDSTSKISPDGFVYTCSSFTPTLSVGPTGSSAYKGGQTLSTSLSNIPSPSFVTNTNLTYTVNNDSVTKTGAMVLNTSLSSGVYVTVRASTMNNTEVLTGLSSDLILSQNNFNITITGTNDATVYTETRSPFISGNQYIPVSALISTGSTANPSVSFAITYNNGTNTLNAGSTIVINEV